MNLINLYLFMNDADQYANFLHRVEAAVYVQAIALRAEDTPSPVTETWRSRQQWANAVLTSPAAKARQMLPGLLVKANDANLLEGGQLADVTDNQILTTVADLVDAYAGHVPEAS